MSFALTTRAYRDGFKTVTRRLGWANLKPGEVVMGIEKGQGLKKGEKVTRIGAFECVSNKRERVDAILNYPKYETALEGFPAMSADEFVHMFCKHNGCTRRRKINRIEFRHLSESRIQNPEFRRGTVTPKASGVDEQ